MGSSDSIRSLELLSGRGKSIIILGLVGLILLGIAYKFRHRIEHFRPDFRFRTLKAITISPSTLELPLGARKRLTAIAHYRDGSVEQAPENVQWVSSSPDVLQVSPEGIVTADKLGVSTVRSTLKKASDAMNVSVVPVAPIALAILPTIQSIPVGGSIQYRVMSTKSDGSVTDVTNSVSWTLSDSFTVELGPSGLAHGRVPGRATVHAELKTPLGKIETQGVLNVTSAPSGFDGVFMYRYDETGTGQNRFETILNPRNVRSTTFGKLFAAPTDGYVYAQPLYVPGVVIPNQGIHNVLYAATENNTIFAFDADNGIELFRKNLGPSVPASVLPCNEMGPKIGITGTPVIDSKTRTLYIAARTYDGGVNSFRLHALDTATGNEKSGSPVLITATVPGHGGGSQGGNLTFDAATQLQRPGLLLLGGQLVVAFGSLCDRGDFHGWLFLYDSSSLARTAVIVTTPDGHHGGIWQAGAAPAVDAAGNIYAISGDGEFDANQLGSDYGDTIMKLKLNESGKLMPDDYFTPYDQREMDVENSDLGSSGPMLLPDQPGQHSHLLFGVSKGGAIYLLDRDHMGKYLTSSNSQIVQCLSNLFSTRIHASAGYWSNGAGQWIFLSSVEGQLQAFSLANGLLSLTPASQTLMTFSYPGVTPVVSSNGDSDGIVWALENSSGVLRAFSATDLTKELYNSNQANNGRDRAERGVQFYVPVVANGKVYFGSRGHVYAYGLLH
ncbi:MAG: Ig-like domain-containing protein [Candidatus Acidiferrales bacterium]